MLEAEDADRASTPAASARRTWYHGLRLDDKTRTFLLAGGAGAFAGSVVGVLLCGDGSLLRVAGWDAFIGTGVGAAIALAQNRELRRRYSGFGDVARAALRCALGGAAGGAGLVITKILLGGGVAGHVAGWALEGLIMGGLLSRIILNLKARDAMLAGAAGGAIGAVLGGLFSALLGQTLGVALADALKGALIGLALTVTEQIGVRRGASLVIHWGGNERSVVLLGEEPVRFGNDSTCRVYVRGDPNAEPHPLGEIVMRGDQITYCDLVTGRVSRLRDGSTLDVGGIRVEVMAQGLS
jgi:hypothetical protein